MIINRSRKLDDSRINNRWFFAREGLPFVLIGCGLTLSFYVLGFLSLSFLFCLVTLFVVFFFRDPSRKNMATGNAVLTPADGKVLQIKETDEDSPFGQKAIKVSIFMSVFNVHVNRIPVRSTVEKITYYPGKFFAASLSKASDHNERNQICLETPDSHRIVLVQIAGLIARRIVCWVKEGDSLGAGQRFGLIRFGSRLDVYLPPDCRITVQMHQKVRAGETVIGYLP